MTLDEYAKSVGDALRHAHNAKSMSELNAAFANADQTLDSNGIGKEQRKRFWAAVSDAAYAGQWLMEKQANSSLAALMQAIQAGLAARTEK